MAGGRGPKLADAVVAELRNGVRPWNSGGTINAARYWYPVFEMEAISSLLVAVVPVAIPQNQAASRKPHKEIDYQIDVTMLKSVTFVGGAEPQAEIDALDLIAEQIFDFYNDRHYLATPTGTDGKPAWKVMDVDRQDIYDANDLNEQQEWSTWIKLTVHGVIG